MLILSIAISSQFFRRAELGGDVIVNMDRVTSFERGRVQHLVSIDFEHDVIKAKRGEIVTIPFTVTHKSHSFWQWITVSDFDQSVKNYFRGKYVEVTVHKFTPQSAIILPNSSTRILMTISIDPLAPDEIVGKSLTLGIQSKEEVAFGGSHLSPGGAINVEVIV